MEEVDHVGVLGNYSLSQAYLCVSVMNWAASTAYLVNKELCLPTSPKALVAKDNEPLKLWAQKNSAG